MLDHAGRGIDDDASGADARYIALALRHGIERTCTEMLDLFGRPGGPSTQSRPARDPLHQLRVAGWAGILMAPC